MWIRFCIYAVFIIPIIYFFWRWASKEWTKAEVEDKLQRMNDDIELSTLVDEEDISLAKEAREKLNQIKEN